MSFAYHGYQAELFPTRIRSRAVGFVYSWSRIAAALSASNSKVAAATREMNALSDRSNALLESLVGARETERAASDEATSSHTDLAVIEARLATAHRILSDWVFSV